MNTQMRTVQYLIKTASKDDKYRKAIEKLDKGIGNYNAYRDLSGLPADEDLQGIKLGRKVLLGSDKIMKNMAKDREKIEDIDALRLQLSDMLNRAGRFSKEKKTIDDLRRERYMHTTVR